MSIGGRGILHKRLGDLAVNQVSQRTFGTDAPLRVRAGLAPGNLARCKLVSMITRCDCDSE
jgi:hypothetical protein